VNVFLCMCRRTLLLTSLLFSVTPTVFAYIGMLRHHFQMGSTDDKGNKIEGLPQWIYDELKSIAALSYQFTDEGDVTEIVEDIAGE